MTTPAHLEHRELAAVASAHRAAAPGITDVQIAADHELIGVRSRLIGIDGLTLVTGASTARRDLVLHIREESPALALHITLRGTATPHVGARAGRASAAEPAHAGQWLIFGGQDTHAVIMEAGVSNAGLRVNFTRSHLEGLAARYPDLFDGELGRDIVGRQTMLLRSEPMALGPLLDLSDTLQASERYGNLRGLFLESAAHELLVRALAGISIAPPLVPRARARMLSAAARPLGSSPHRPSKPL
jgi:hypothetical protein